MSKIRSSSKIQRLLKDSSLLCLWKKLNKLKVIYQALVKLISNHPELLFSLNIREYNPLLLKHPEELTQVGVKIKLKNLSKQLRSSYD
jgi:hypothetical protein